MRMSRAPGQGRDVQDVTGVLQAALAVGLILAEKRNAAVKRVRFDAGVAARLGQRLHIGVRRAQR